MDMPTVFIKRRSKPLCTFPVMYNCSKPTDGGHLLLSDNEKIALLNDEPKASRLIKPFLCARESLYGMKRWCLWLKDVEPSEYSTLPMIIDRIQKVKEYRANSIAASTRKYPYHHLFKNVRQPKRNYMLIPRVTASRRDYIPCSHNTPDMIVSASFNIIDNPTLYHFGVLQSKMHMVWIKIVCTTKGISIDYSIGVVYNNFPWPKGVSIDIKQQIEAAAQKVLDARATWPNATLAHLYDPLKMPENLLKAHHALDTLVDRAYREQPFISDMDRVKFLFTLYQQYIEEEEFPLAA